MGFLVDPWDGFPYGSRSWHTTISWSIDIFRMGNSLNIHTLREGGVACSSSNMSKESGHQDITEQKPVSSGWEL